MYLHTYMYIILAGKWLYQINVTIRSVLLLYDDVYLKKESFLYNDVYFS
jgi:uncharacterized protein YqgQ